MYGSYCVHVTREQIQCTCTLDITVLTSSLHIIYVCYYIFGTNISIWSGHMYMYTCTCTCTVHIHVHVHCTHDFFLILITGGKNSW